MFKIAIFQFSVTINHIFFPETAEISIFNNTTLDGFQWYMEIVLKKELDPENLIEKAKILWEKALISKINFHF